MSTCYVNPNAYFFPSMRLIYSITKSRPAIITTTNNTTVTGGVLVAVPAVHGYSSGLIVRLLVPEACGMQQINDFYGEIVVIDAYSFSMDIDSTGFDDFSIPVAPIPAWADTCAQVIPFAENNASLLQATVNMLP